MENERVLEIYTSQQQKYDGYRDGGGKKETNKTKVWGVRERAYIKAWWIRNSTPSCGLLRRHSCCSCCEVDRMMSLGTPRHRRPSRNRTSKSSVHGSAAGHDWVRPEPGQGSGCEARRKPRLVAGRHRLTAHVVLVWVSAGTCVTRGAVVRARVPFPVDACRSMGVGFNGQGGTLGSSSSSSSSKGLVETRHAVAIPT